MLSSVWARSCFWIGISTPHQIFPHPLFLFTLYFIIIITILLLYFQRVHTSDNDQITYNVFRFHISIKKGITTPLHFFFSSWKKNLDNKFRDLLQK
jgi:hypothetical protein